MIVVGVDVQIACADRGLPEPGELRTWARAALAAEVADSDLTLRVVDLAEGRRLNETYRAASGPTNVLSFPFEAPPGVGIALLGDVIICAPVVAREACEQGIAARAHWAHMVVHGLLHLQGYDHQRRDEAERMESRERQILARLGFSDPYAEARE